MRDMTGAPMTRVLVVDDEPRLARMLVINLEARKYDVDCAQDGVTALDAVAACRPDVVLLDLGLPDMDGIEVIRRLRVCSQVPVVVVSAWHGSNEKIEALDAGSPPRNGTCWRSSSATGAGS